MGASEAAWLPHVFEAVPVAMMALDGSGRALAINSKGEELLSLGDRDIKGLPFDEVRRLLPDSVQVSLGRILAGESELEEGEVAIGGQAVGYTASRARSSPEVSAVLMLKPQGAARSAEQGDFLSAAAHQLKTPLTAIKGGTQLLARRLRRGAAPLESRDQKLLDMISEQVNRLTGMVDGLLETSRLSSGRIQLVLERRDLREVLCEAIATYETQEPTSTIQLVAGTGPFPVTCDQRRVAQIFEALLHNANAHSKPGDPITVKLARVRSGETCVSVSDRGPGILPSDQPHVFERFYRGEETSQGLGLGLYIASELVQLHGGRIWLDSVPGHGATFHFTLPSG